MTLNDFRRAIEQADLTAPETIIPDGKLHRFASNRDREDAAGWYIIFPDGVPAGVFGCWRSGVKQTWCGKSDRQLTEVAHPPGTVAARQRAVPARHPQVAFTDADVDVRPVAAEHHPVAVDRSAVHAAGHRQRDDPAGHRLRHLPCQGH